VILGDVGTGGQRRDDHPQHNGITKLLHCMARMGRSYLYLVQQTGGSCCGCWSTMMKVYVLDHFKVLHSLLA
jgi:hypothetical protein